MPDKEHKSARKNAKNGNDELKAALARAKQDIAQQVQAKQQVACFLNLLNKDDLTGEVSASLSEEPTQQDDLNYTGTANNIMSLSEQYKQLLQKNKAASNENVGRIKQIDMHPLTTNDFLHHRHHANRSLGSELLYNTFMQDKQKQATSLNKALSIYLFADDLSGNEQSTESQNNEADSNNNSYPRAKEDGREAKYAIRLSMLSQHSDDFASLIDTSKQNKDFVWSQATWSNPRANEYKLCWKELSDPSLYSEYTEMIYNATNKELSIIRPGEFFLKLNFRKGSILQSNYHTPYGDIPMITETKQMECDVSSPEKGYVKLLYFLSNDNQHGHYVSLALTYSACQAPLTKENFK